LLTLASLTTDFRALGMTAGDTIFVHSAYTTLSRAPGGVEGGPQTVIEAILSVIGPGGTLIMPTFNYDFLRGTPWDMRTSPSQMGVLTEVVRKDPRAKRMFHPVYSMAAIGAHADEVAAQRATDCFGETTIFSKFREWDAKILILGLAYSKSITFLHHCEQAAGVDYRFLKEFKGAAIDAQGKPSEETITMFVRDVERGVVLDFEPIGALLDSQAADRRLAEAELLREVLSGANRAGIVVEPGSPVETALAYHGVPYLWGGATPSGFDCSGLILYVYKQHGVNLPHYSGAQFQLGEKISPAGLQPGDVVFFGSPVYHVGMYVGAGYFIHAPRTGDFVKLSKLADRKDYAGARRYDWSYRTGPIANAAVNPSAALQ